MKRNTSDAENFRADWERFHPTCPPLGFALRLQEDSPWIRFHALPGSKQYAEDAEDRATILQRGNKLGDEILGQYEYCWVIEWELEVSAPADVVMTARETDDPDDPEYSFYARRERWCTGSYNAKLLSIANDGPRRALWMRCDNGAVFAPYDGGFDLFPTSWQEVAALRLRWSSWLPVNS